MKQPEIPTEYLSNDINDLKRAALVNKDIELLRALDKSIKRSKGWRVLYARLDESVLREASGEIVRVDSTGLDDYDFALNFFRVGYAPSLKNPSSGWPDGHLYRSLNSSSTIQTPKVAVYELPPDTEFPIPEAFGWDEWLDSALRYLKSTNIRVRNIKEWAAWMDQFPEDRFFPDRVKSKIYRYKDNFGNTILTNSPPADGRPYTVE